MTGWVPLSVLPNISLQNAVEGGFAALVPHDDPRVTSLCRAHPVLQSFLSKFTDAFGAPVYPSIILLRDNAPDRFRNIDAIASFRDAIAISALSRSRTLDLIYKRTGTRARWSNSFSLYPWMLSKDHQHLIATTPAFLGLHEVRKFRGQSSPEVPEVTLDTFDFDMPLLNELLRRWRRRYSGASARWPDQALYRSLNMANQAAQLPAGIDTTFYDVGRNLALWVSAFEILAHPRVAQSGVLKVYELFERVNWQIRDVGRRRYKTNNGRLKNPPRRNLACWIYSEIYDARNAFLHGNRVTQKNLTIQHSGRGLIEFAVPLYRLALTGFLQLNWSKPVPSYQDNPKLFGKYVSERGDFESAQGKVEQALLKARQSAEDD